MNLIQMLGVCPQEFIDVMKIVRFVLNVLCIAIPIILIVLIIFDLAKIVTAGNIDDKLKKEVTSKVVTRLIFAVLILLVPTIVRLVFGILPLPDRADVGPGSTWQDCWDRSNATL